VRRELSQSIDFEGITAIGSENRGLDGAKGA
jgi:hypothetical protein